MTIISKERALPVIENAFKQQSLVENLCDLMNSDGNELHTDIAGVVKTVFDFDYTEFERKEYDRHYDTFYNLLKNKDLSHTEKARLFYDQMLELITGHSTTIDEIPQNVLDLAIHDIIINAIRFELVTRSLQGAIDPFIPAKNSIAFRDNYRGCWPAYFLMGVKEEQFEVIEGLTEILDQKFSAAIDKDIELLMASEINPLQLAQEIARGMRVIISNFRARQNTAA